MKNYLLIFTLFLITATGCNYSNAEPQKETASLASTTTNIPAVLPAFKIMDLKGNTVNLADFKGKKVFVNLWASWCPPCRAEIPSIEKLYGKADKNKVAFVMLNLDKDLQTAQNFTEKNKIKTPVYYPAENLAPLFNVEGIPATFIFDEKGNLINRIDGMDNYDTDKYLKLFTN